MASTTATLLPKGAVARIIYEELEGVECTDAYIHLAARSCEDLTEHIVATGNREGRKMVDAKLVTKAMEDKVAGGVVKNLGHFVTEAQKWKDAAQSGRKMTDGELVELAKEQRRLFVDADQSARSAGW